MPFVPLILSDISSSKPVRRTFGEQTYHNFNAIAAYGAVTPLGGSPDSGHAVSGWSRVPGYLPARMNRTLASGYTRQVVALTRTLASGSNVNWRVVDDQSNVLVVGTAHGLPVWQQEIKPVVPAADGRRHYLEIQNLSGAYTVQGYGVIEQFLE